MIILRVKEPPCNVCSHSFPLSFMLFGCYLHAVIWDIFRVLLADQHVFSLPIYVNIKINCGECNKFNSAFFSNVHLPYSVLVVKNWRGRSLRLSNKLASQFLFYVTDANCDTENNFVIVLLNGVITTNICPFPFFVSVVCFCYFAVFMSLTQLKYTYRKL